MVSAFMLYETAEDYCCFASLVPKNKRRAFQVRPPAGGLLRHAEVDSGQFIRSAVRGGVDDERVEIIAAMHDDDRWSDRECAGWVSFIR